jgi:2-polyprenyl-6-methoxyphenol hydroxylase-like FAD-dependent oxidoreductase
VSMPNRIVIVGGGFCGTVLAAALLRRPPREPTQVVLVERAAQIGRGMAYASHEVAYLSKIFCRDRFTAIICRIIWREQNAMHRRTCNSPACMMRSPGSRGWL